jgi:plasmid maintenance system antidote protein VapI
MTPFQPYDPNGMLNAIISKLLLNSDAELERLSEVQAPVISKIRHHRMVVSGAMLLRIHEATGLSMRALQNLMGDRRLMFRFRLGRDALQ